MCAHAVSMRNEWKRFEGQVLLSKFPLQKLLGSTSYSAVFLTQSPPPEPKNIAVKLINPGATAGFQVSLFQRASKLTHPNLLHLLPGGRCKLADMDLVFTFIEYAEEDLGRSLQDRALSETETREMLGPLLEALSYIHGKGLAHSHIKPSNIVAIGNQIKLASDTVLPLGEPRPAFRPLDTYCAPEAAAAPVAVSNDVWSLGVTLVEVLTQKAPVSSPESQDGPVVPSTIQQPFLDIAQNCLRRDSQLRWTTAQIAECLNPAPIEVSTPEAAASAEKEEEPAKEKSTAVQVAAPEATVSTETKREPPKEKSTAVQVAAPEATVSTETKREPPKELWVDSDYYWVVVCKNHGFHGRGNFADVHRIPLGETDPVLPRPEIDKPFAVRCDECGKEYLYKPSDVLKYEMDAPASFVPHPLFRDSLQPDKTDKHESTPPPQPTPRKPRGRTLEWAVGITFLMFIVPQFVLSNLPKLSVDVSGSLRPNDQMGTTLNLNNKGVLPVYDVKARCDVKRVDISPPVDTRLAGPTAFNPAESRAETLSPGQEMTVPCARAISISPDSLVISEIHAEVFIVVSYRPKGVWWHRSEKFPMEAKKTEKGTWMWKSIPR